MFSSRSSSGMAGPRAGMTSVSSIRWARRRCHVPGGRHAAKHGLTVVVRPVDRRLLAPIIGAGIATEFGDGRGAVVAEIGPGILRLGRDEGPGSRPRDGPGAFGISRIRPRGRVRDAARAAYRRRV